MSDEKEADPRDVLAGQNLTVLRGEMTQAALAKQMRDRGWKWSQATVWAIEKGERPLRVAEAVDVLHVLKGDSVGGIEWHLLRPSTHSQLGQAGRAAKEAWESVVDAMVDFRNRQLDLAFLYSRARDEDLDLRVGDLALVDSWLAEDALEYAIEEANRRWRKRFAEDEDPTEEIELFKGRESPRWTQNPTPADDKGDDGQRQEEA
ncbi:hypothetical protein [Cellulosimicrobium funkei]|uniref:Uncharacterized protein n=1 Tax=Cellulosimicrobium funkei TaxID=264251 RepID=A0A4Y8QXY8_9MICO|nr:hypothetical protein [Cellulosimicrobium funkei]TFF03722.1 hypothetical protein E1O70_19430 [Cellulosimicrobium funkei]TGA67366.1 hypothetical protein EQW79_019265 [Cellulosimicrobium terreum]